MRFIAHESDMADANLKTMAEGISNSKEVERVRVARELEQGANVHLINAKNRIDFLVESSSAPQQEKILEVRKEVRKALDHIYGVVCDLRPPKLVESGLKPALRDLVARMTKANGCQIAFRFKGDESRLKTEIETALYRVTDLALNNIVSHSKADEAEVWLIQSEKLVQVTIKDKGVGFDASSKADINSGLGEMRLLMSAINGRLRLFSTPYMGSMLRLEVPLT